MRLGLQHLLNARRAVAAGPVGCDQVRIVVVDDLVVGDNIQPALGIAGPGAVPSKGIKPSRCIHRSSRERAPAVAAGAHRNPARDDQADIARDVGVTMFVVGE